MGLGLAIEMGATTLSRAAPYPRIGAPASERLAIDVFALRSGHGLVMGPDICSPRWYHPLCFSRLLGQQFTHCVMEASLWPALASLASFWASPLPWESHEYF